MFWQYVLSMQRSLVMTTTFCHKDFSCGIFYETMKIEVGKVLKAQGIKGEIKIGCYLDNPEMLRGVKKLYIGVNEYTVVKLRRDGTFCYASFAEITDRNAAEAMRNWAVYAEKEDLAVPNGRYFVNDLVGSRVTSDNGFFVGVVIDVLQYGAADVLVCKNGDKEVSFPFLKDLVLSVNVESKSITLSQKRFVEVAVYED